MSKPILSAGRLYCDLVFAETPRLPTLGTEVFSGGLTLHAGGGAFITGATLSMLGHTVWQFSYLPAAPFDMVIRADLAERGLVTTGCLPALNGVDPQITVAIPNAGDRAFLTRADGPSVPDSTTINFHDFAHLHIGELSTLQEVPKLLELARVAGLTVSLDCGWQDVYDPDVADLISKVDIFLPNESEAAALSAIGVPETCAALTVVKNGKNGARACARNSNDWTHSPAPIVKVLDATGAGDAFNAGFIDCWLDDASLDKCLSAGNACGSAAVQVHGGVACFKQSVPA